MLTLLERWPYKFVHAILRIVLEAGNLNLQAHTPATSISQRDDNGWITVTTDRGELRARTVIHTTNRWASHLLPEFSKLILGERATLAAIKAPEGFIKHTGAQHWDQSVNVSRASFHFEERCFLTLTELPSSTTFPLQCHHSRRRETIHCPYARSLFPER